MYRSRCSAATRSRSLATPQVGAAHWREMAVKASACPSSSPRRRSREHLLRLGPAAAHDRQFIFAGFSARAVELAGPSPATRVPAEAELVLEGTSIPPSRWCSRAVRRPHRILLARDYYPLVHVTAITGGAIRSIRPPWSARRRWRLLLGHATERSFSRSSSDGARDRRLSHAGRRIFHNLVFVSIDKQYPGRHIR